MSSRVTWMHLLTKIKDFSNLMYAETAVALLSAKRWKKQYFVQYVTAQDIIIVLIKVVRIKNMGFVIMLAELVSMYFITGSFNFTLFHYCIISYLTYNNLSYVDQ